MSEGKASVDEIRTRFDNDVERFSSLETGQVATQDAALVMGMIANAAARVTPHAKTMTDLGCGAGNFSLKFVQQFSLEQVTLVDLSRNMLDRAVTRLQEAAPSVRVTALQMDVREVELARGSQDLITAAAVLHHLRTDVEWSGMFHKIFQALRPGGSLWIWDFLEHDVPGLEAEMRARWGEYLAALKGEEYRDHVFAYVAYEDTPRSMAFQLAQLTAAGFTADVIHKQGCFGAICAVRP